MKFKCVIFDLDGTLVDTIGDITASVNRALSDNGYSLHSEDEYYTMVGWGWRRLCTLALPEEERSAERVEAIFGASLAYYAENPVAFTKPYRGIPELLVTLKQKKIKTAVLTNKPDSLAQAVTAAAFPADTFSAVYGERPEQFPRKPDPGSTWELLLELDASPRETVFVGDSEVDVATALAADCHSIGVSWGYRDKAVLEKAGAQRVIDTPGDLLEIIQEKF
ncbi:HAD family hydrolase [Breznakiella homolactica]|uniref:phosphoglycolate phosphatase n=1 Tax=Breznakiella homolactica TaxID=2798577 RepID=A0A7T7XLT2_9SPIR|nr:HAD-IA family hydrolase [Breznakiella homolactica]QQO08637.1 HAD-IA family hydrolase [Breznakiella homolactica]